MSAMTVLKKKIVLKNTFSNVEIIEARNSNDKKYVSH